MSPSRFSPEYDALRRLLQAEREKSGVTQRELCKLLGRRSTYVFKLESGELRKIDLVEVLAYLRALKVEPREFLVRFVDEIETS